MSLSKSEHTSRPWRIHELTADFRVEDVWALPTPGDREGFHRLVELMAHWDPSTSASRAVRTLFAIRARAGELLGWDEQGPGGEPGSGMVGDRLPPDLRRAPSGPRPERLPFTPLYLLEDEWALEVANRTVHGVLHLGWVPAEDGRYRGQLAILVKRKGLLGSAYMAAIAPFRHLLLYPRMQRELGREWRRLEPAESRASRGGPSSP